MSENNEPSYEEPATALTHELGWESLDEQSSVEQPSASERTVIKLPGEGRASPRRHVRRAAHASGEPARTGRHARLAWLAALAAAALAGCLAIAIALLSTGAPARPDSARSPSTKPRSALRRPRSRHEHDRRPSRRAKTPAAQLPGAHAGDSNPPPAPQAPETSRAPSASPPAPPEQTVEGQAGGGPFSP